MAVLFLDISGFSGRPSETQAEQDAIVSAFTVFFTEMVRIAEDYGGTVEKNTGDGLMAYFEDGGGTPAEGGAKRAVSCALTMMDTAAQVINPLLNAVQIAPLSFRIAIDHGQVTIAKVGAAKRFNSMVAIGTAANVASKMLAFAQRGEIVIGDTVKTRLPAYWHLAWTQLIDQDTGWIYRASGLRYPFYRYIGRWVHKRGLP
jgi:class 3 adenylate cyclase